MSRQERILLWLHSRTIKTRLLLLLALVLMLTQCASAVWVWHESREQLVELVQLAANPHHSRHEL